MSARWPIERHWSISASKGETRSVTNDGLAEFRACGLLGSAGLGKSFELSSMAEVARRQGRLVEHWRLALLGLSQESLQTQLDRIADRASEETLILLDALDEVMIPLRTAAFTLEKWILEALKEKRPQLRISCRSAVWPHVIGEAFLETYGKEACVTAQLQPLNDEDIRNVAADNGIDADAFLAEVEAVNATSLSQQPLTLEMLMKVFRGSGKLPPSRERLFRDGIETLADERTERLTIKTTSETPTPVLLEASERLACISLLSGRSVVDLNDSTTDSALGRRELGRLPGEPPLSFDLLQDIGRCGLSESDDPLQFRFAHRQFAEYLAGRRIATLLPHQAKSLLCAGGDLKAGVAGPLRETAAFAAITSPAIATWVTETDPEVIGLSDVASDDLRKRATAKMLDKFRKQELTDSQVGRAITELSGFKYSGAASDLRAVLLERQEGCEDVLEFAIELIESWKLVSLCDDLATLMLDASAPLESRKGAGYALTRLGTPDICVRLLPLLEAVQGDANMDLKGLALKCNWPANLSTQKLLEDLPPSPTDNYHGAYDGFLFDLDYGGFDACDDLLAGLKWAKQFVGHDLSFSSGAKIARRIAATALSRISEPGIVDALADLLIAAESQHGLSPLVIDREVDAPAETTSPLASLPDKRRELLKAIVSKLADKDSVWMVVHDTPGLVDGNDSRWLIREATDETIPMPQREHLAQLARMCPWKEPVEDFEAWFAVRDVEPIATFFRMPLSIELGSKEAEQAKRVYLLSTRKDRKPKRKRIQPSPAVRVSQVLLNCETKDPRFFANLCRELTLEEFSVQYRYERFLTRSPGWNAADQLTQSRILAAAKQYLVADLTDIDDVRTIPLSRILNGPMQAIWLLLECDRSFLEALAPTWWSKWAWYILRELHFNMADEEQEPKSSLIDLLCKKAANAVHAELEQLTQSDEERATQLLSELLDSLIDKLDEAFDSRLCHLLSSGKVKPDRISVVAQFVLARRHAASLSTCLALIEPTANASGEQVVVEILEALLQQRIGESWGEVYVSLSARADLARVVLEKFASDHRLNRATENESFLNQLTFAQVGQLVSLLIKVFPYEDDIIGAKSGFLAQRDLAERLRDQLINWLGDQKDFGAVEALRGLERELGAKNTWLKRPRAQAERNYRLSIWNPIPPVAVAEILIADKKRLIRSPHDAAEGIVAAIEEFEFSLRHASPNGLDDLWLLPSKGRAEPRPEERISEKICGAVRGYFDRFGLCADREVQVFRRKVSAAENGAPGSEVDVMCRVPAIGTSGNDPIAVPIEVKLAHNPEARTGLKEQLFDRYMSQLGSNVGVFVVVWMGNLPPYRPLWKSVEAARQELCEIAATLSIGGAPCEVQVVVIDASLPMAKSKRANPRGKKEPRAKQPSKKTDTNRPSTKSKDAKALKYKKLLRPKKEAKAAKKPTASAKRVASPQKAKATPTPQKKKASQVSGGKKRRMK